MGSAITCDSLKFVSQVAMESIVLSQYVQAKKYWRLYPYIRVACEGDDLNSPKTQRKVKQSNDKKSKSPPIPVSYFPVGTRFSRL
ncbi:hypothetical protein RJ640_005622 [Escallonia rubra]|uniref:Uncharacterized protein n=1 Tax=Escallonia rubra TaxID=112253 RepID=A0AA88QR97_9ASTE|nr:hypothetical protein RJ640_005622 [Escallonia rubra]